MQWLWKFAWQTDALWDMSSSRSAALLDTAHLLTYLIILQNSYYCLENKIWRSQLATWTKLKLYNTWILPIFLYGSDCWAISKTDTCRIDALDQWCLRMLLGIKWYQFVLNDDVRRLTKQPKLTAIIQSRRLTLFGHIMRMDNNADAKRILLASPPADWKRQPVVPAMARITWLSTVQQDLNNTTLCSQKQQIWLRTALCGGWCRRMVLCNLRVACQKWQQRPSIAAIAALHVSAL